MHVIATIHETDNTQTHNSFNNPFIVMELI